MLIPLLTAFGAALGLNYLLARNLIKPLSILAQVNRRSAHKNPVPVGGGIGIILGLGLSIPFTDSVNPHILIPLCFTCLALSALSWWNDKVDVRASIRLGAQALAAGYCLSLLPSIAWWLLPFLFFGLIWFTNLYNFMDGSDGIMAVQTIAISLGIALISQSLLPLCIAAATLGFLYFNWPPAKLFAGDVGSIPLGFFIGFLLLLFGLEFGIAPAFILPLYFIMDASITLFKRILKREKIWEAHAQHYYQQAIQKGFSHRRVMLTVAGVNLILILCANESILYPIPSTLLAVLAVSLCLWHFRKPT